MNAVIIIATPCPKFVIESLGGRSGGHETRGGGEGLRAQALPAVSRSFLVGSGRPSSVARVSVLNQSHTLSP